MFCLFCARACHCQVEWLITHHYAGTRASALKLASEMSKHGFIISARQGGASCSPPQPKSPQNTRQSREFQEWQDENGGTGLGRVGQGGRWDGIVRLLYPRCDVRVHGL